MSSLFYLQFVPEWAVVKSAWSWDLLIVSLRIFVPGHRDRPLEIQGCWCSGTGTDCCLVWRVVKGWLHVNQMIELEYMHGVVSCSFTSLQEADI